jgi:RNA polymerase sigma-70 factor (ECF subfamily)
VTGAVAWNDAAPADHPWSRIALALGLAPGSAGGGLGAPRAPGRALTSRRVARPDPACPDVELVRRCVDGDRRAFDELYRRHVDAVHRRLARLLGRSDEVDDLVQQVFLEAFRALPGFRGEAALATWLHRIAINLALGALRARRRRPTAPLGDELLELVPAPGASPEQLARDRELCARVLRHLEKVKPRQRIAFVLRHVEELSLDEIAALVGANPPAVAQRVKQAERRLLEGIARDERRVERRRGDQP